MRELNDKAYTSQLISLGPYHYGKAHLTPMECNKHAALIHYLEWANKTLGKVRESMRPQIQDLMDAYDSLEEPWTDKDRFLDLMILDGCFFLKMMVWGNAELWRRYMNHGLWMDMRRIENQLSPLFLVILIEIGSHEVEDFKNFIRNCDEIPDTELKTIRGKGRHLLDISKRKMTAEGNCIHDHDSTVRTATELFQAGVSFKQADSIISFTNGVLKLPHLCCHSNTKNMFLNYTAYEHIHKGTDSAATIHVSPPELVIVPHHHFKKEASVKDHQIQEPVLVRPRLFQAIVRVHEVQDLRPHGLPHFAESLIGPLKVVDESRVLVALHGLEAGLVVVVRPKIDELGCVGLVVELSHDVRHPVDAMLLSFLYLGLRVNTLELFKVDDLLLFS
ncbi:uncharacterized protein A4U43_C03F2630 [Asparagus officinalis]|uniref:Uncharacterized protein n=1 Tax=Asparagus officinalis TaxID=4686 RepID=A0A5P1F6S8_ASPOF|nr:uncharacterized protein A4U43_C03F2630 [Asparagus officinalis]